MEEVYNRLTNEFIKKRNSISFNPNELERLSNAERKSIEEKLLRLCKSGSIDCFKYITYMRCVSPEEEITLEDISSLPPFHQTSISFELFKRTNNTSYFETMAKCANFDIKSFGLMVSMYNGVTDQNLKSRIKSSLLAIVQNATGEFKENCEKLLKRSMIGDSTITIEPNQTENLGEPSQTMPSRFETEEIKAYTGEEYHTRQTSQSADSSKILSGMLEAIKNLDNYENSNSSLKNK